MRRAVSALALLAAPVLAAATAATAAPPVAAYGQLPSLGEFSLSPDGTRFAAIVGSDEGAELQVRSLADGALVMASPAGRYKLRAVQWAGPDFLVLTIGQTRQMNSDDFIIAGRGEYYQALRYDFRAKAWKRLMENVPLTGNTINGPPVVVMNDGKPQLIVSGFSIPTNAVLPSVFRIDLASGGVRVVERGSPETEGFVIDGNGAVVARSEYNQKTGVWKVAANRNPGWAEIYRETALVDSPSLLGLGRTPGTVRVETRKSGEWEIHELALADGAWTPEEEADATGAVNSDTTQAPIAYATRTMAGVDYQFIDPADARLWRGITRSFAGAQVDFEGWTPDRSKVAVNVFGGAFGNGLYIVDRVAKTAGLLSQRYAGIEAADIAKVEAITYKAADGTDIPAYLTLPNGRTAKGLPLIVLPHGGPAVRDEPGFDWWAQAFASRGYAVLQPQFRGSGGFGAAFRDAGFGQWGRKMQTDVSDGVRHLAAQGMIDPKRVCVVGGSYGGYVAMAGVTLQQGVYRCASSFAGVSDLGKWLQRRATGDRRNTESGRTWQRFIGSDNPDDPKVAAVSPARQIARLNAPLQLIHGTDDLVVPIEQSQFMADAAKAAGKTVEFISVPRQDHWLSSAAGRVAVLEAQIAFVLKHNPPD
ncbi:MAG: S9 family peptidase [Sphingomonadales bacterium]